MLTVMTQNLNYYGDRHGAWPQRRELLCAAIRDARPDVIALQAVCSAPEIEDGADQATQLSRELPDHRYVFFYPAHISENGREEGSAMLSRIPIREPGVRELSLRPGLEDANPRVIQHARFDLDKHSLNVFNAYFSWVEEQAADNIREGLAFLGKADEPTLLVGDFNTPAGSPLLDELKAAGYTDLWEQTHPREDGFTFEANHPDRRIDYAWANADLLRRVEGVDLVRRDEGSVRPSDHLGLKVSLDLH
jgi:endonuclease/exonuclease/phosphatase family metal-dependent hydrolase